MDYYEDDTSVYIVLELCPNKTLNDLIKSKKRLSEHRAMFYLLDLVEALKYLHNKLILHRDLKLGNLFLDEHMHIKVGDFGLAGQLSHKDEKRQTVSLDVNALMLRDLY